MDAFKPRNTRSNAKGHHRSASFEHYQSSGIVDDEETGKPVMRGALRRFYCATTPHSSQNNLDALENDTMSNNAGCATYAFLPGAEDLEESINGDSGCVKFE